MQPAQTVSPVSLWIPFMHAWTEGARVRQPRVFLLTVGFRRDRGLLLKPLGQLQEAVIRRLSVMMQASGHDGLLLQ